MPANASTANIILCLFVFAAGACIGSFLNVLIYRIPRKIPFVYGTSFCPSCGKRVMPCDLVPVVSYIFLKGKCRYCGAGISLLYPIIELVTGGLAIAFVLLYGFTLQALLFFSVSAILLTVSFIDAGHMIIPDGLVIALAPLAAVSALAGIPPGISLLSRIIGFLILSLPMLLLTFLIPNAFGGGDIKLIAVCGFLLGVKLTLAAGFIAVFLGAAYGIFVKYIIRRKDATHIAFGQYICIGAFASLLWGEEIIQLYLSFVFY